MIAIYTKWAMFSLNASVQSQIWRLFKNNQGSISDKETTNSKKVTVISNIWHLPTSLLETQSASVPLWRYMSHTHIFLLNLIIFHVKQQLLSHTLLRTSSIINLKTLAQFFQSALMYLHCSLKSTIKYFYLFTGCRYCKNIIQFGSYNHHLCTFYNT